MGNQESGRSVCSSHIQVPCKISEAQTVTLHNVCGESHCQTACKVVSLQLQETSSSSPVAIKFRNYYTHTVSVLAKGDSWRCVVSNWCCMRESCHCETGGQTWQYLHSPPIPWLSDVTEFCLILRQPSPVWKDFRIDNISVYCNGNQESSSNDMTEYVASCLMTMANSARAPPLRTAPMYSNVDSLATD